MSYNGWQNYETWNVALWISNEEELSVKVEDFNRARPLFGTTYKDFIAYATLTETLDGVDYLDPELDYPNLDEFISGFGC